MPIFWAQNTIKTKNIAEYRQRIGMVFQNFNVFPHMTVLDNITLTPILEKKIPRAEAEDRADELLRRVGMLDKRGEYPFMVKEVLTLIADLARSGMTMLVVTHEMGFAREVSDRILFIDEGIVQEEGSPEEFFTSPRSARAIDFLSKVL